MRGNVLVVDDQPLPRTALANELREGGFAVREATNGCDGWEQFCEAAPDIVITDLVMPAMDGLKLVSRIRLSSDVPVIVFSAHGTVENTAAAFKAGANDFLSIAELEENDLLSRIAGALGTTLGSTEDAIMRQYFAGSSESMLTLRTRLAALAPVRCPVLVVGLSGTGRDTAVRALHELGPTASGVLSRVQPNSVVSNLSSASTESIYLDSFDTFPAASRRAWLLRIAELKERNYEGTKRIFLSSVRSLVDWLQDPEFNAQGASSLADFIVKLPDVDDFRDDLPAIAASLCEKISDRLGRAVHLSPSAVRFIEREPWRGQVREIALTIEKAIILSAGSRVGVDSLRRVVREQADSVEVYRRIRSDQERAALIAALRESGGNVSQTARRLNRSRGAIYRMLKKYGIPFQERIKKYQ